MKYNFDSIIDRKNTNSLKWDLFDDEYPMWVADMDFYAIHSNGIYLMMNILCGLQIWTFMQLHSFMNQ